MFIVKTAAAAALLAFASTSALADTAPCTRTYNVVAGDTCNGISVAQKVPLFQFYAANPTVNSDCYNLEVGQSVCLATQGSDCGTDVYSVKQGDVCDSIAAAHNINTTMLMLNNPQIDSNCYNLFEGEVLCTANTVKAAPVPATFNDPTPPGAVPATPQPAADPAPVPQPAASDPPTDDDDLPYCDQLDPSDPDYGYL